MAGGQRRRAAQGNTGSSRGSSNCCGRVVSRRRVTSLALRGCKGGMSNHRSGNHTIVCNLGRDVLELAKCLARNAKAG